LYRSFFSKERDKILDLSSKRKKEKENKVEMVTKIKDMLKMVT
jgi:hypothetical protein